MGDVATVPAQWPAAKERLTAIGIHVVEPGEHLEGEEVADLIKSYGWLVADQFTEEQKKRWQLKLILPDARDVDVAQAALQKDQGESFQALVEAISEPVSRLVAIHLFNALIANKLSLADARTVNLAAWGATEQFFNRKIPFSLVPLTSAYAPREIHESYPDALAAAVMNDLQAVRHSQVKECLKRIILDLANNAP